MSWRERAASFSLRTMSDPRVADRPFRQVAEENLPPVDHPPEVETGSGLADDRRHHRVREKCSRLIEHGFLPERARPTGERVVKKIKDGMVLDVAQNIGAVSVIGKEFCECEERCRRWLLDEGPQRIAEDVFEPRSPRVHPELLEDAHDVRDDETALFSAWAIEYVETESVGSVLRIEKNNVVLPVSGDVFGQQVIVESAVRIDYRKPGPGGQVGCRHVSEPGAFAGSGAAEECHVFSPGLGRHAELWLAEKSVCVDPDRGGLKHAGDL
jgi:hypothetical protein